MNIYLDTFKTFAKIGAFTLGGGYAMLPLIEDEVVRKKQWVKSDEFLDLVAIAQSAPGVFAVNISIFVGYKLKGVKGAIACTLGSVLPSFFIILLIALFFHQFKDNEVVEKIFKGIRPAVVALIAAPVFRLAKAAKINRYNVWIPVVCALLIWLLGISPVWIILIAGVAGYVYGKFYLEEEANIPPAPKDETERIAAEAIKKAKKEEQNLKEIQKKIEKAQKLQEKARRQQEEAQRKEAEMRQMIPEAQQKAQKARAEAEKRKEERRRVQAEEPNLFSALDPRRVREDNDPSND